MAKLQDVLAEKIPAWREEIRELVAEHGDRVISEVTVRQAYGGMRGVKALVCDTSTVDPEQGLFVRGIPIGTLVDRCPEEVFFLLCTGELPDERALADLRGDLLERTDIPRYVWNVVNAMPPECHPMSMLSAAILVLARESQFRRRYAEGIPKTDHWKPVLEDALNLIAKLPIIAAGIYRIGFGKGLPIQPTRNHDWAGYFAEALGIEDPQGQFADLVRLYLVLHCDHESGNVSANTCHTVGSSLADPYLSVTAGLNGLAGPLHGLANQESLRFVLEVRDRFGGVPTDKQLIDYTWETLKAGRVIPGYGHAVLRQTDPRFIALHAFGQRVCPDDEVFQIVDKLYRLIPGVLKEQGKAANPYPNVDAGSGCLLYHFGIKQLSFYTVFFAISRCLGLLSQRVINRAIGTPIMRPKSVTTQWIKQAVAKPAGPAAAGQPSA